MGCKSCGAVAIPQSDPPICPGCFVRASRRPALVVGIQDVPLTFEQIDATWPGHVKRVEFDSKKFTYLMTDLGHLVLVDNASGMPVIWLDDEARWLSWDDYVAVVSE